MKSFYTILIALACCLASIATNAQHIIINPSNPYYGEQFEIATSVGFGTLAKKHYCLINQIADTFFIDFCYSEGFAATIVIFKDTFKQSGILPGSYTVKLMKNESSSNDSCLSPITKQIYYQNFVVQNPLSLSKIESINFTLHPNPATTHFTITTPHNLTGNTLTIHNTIGQQVATHTIPPNHTILLDKLPKGIYYIQTNYQTTPIKTKLIIQ